MESSQGTTSHVALPPSSLLTEENRPQDEITAASSAIQPEVERILTEVTSQTRCFYQRLLNDLTNVAGEKAKLQKAHKRIEQLEKRIRQQDEELEYHRREIFKSINTSNISDRLIADELATIYVGLSNWVECLPEPSSRGCNWLGITQFLGQRNYSGEYGQGFSIDTATQAREELLTHAVFCILWKNILQPLLVGTSHMEESFLQELASKIPLVQPQKGKPIKFCYIKYLGKQD